MLTDDAGNAGIAAHHHEGEGPARFAPDGHRIAFDSDHEGDSETFLMDEDGSNLRRVSWSPGMDLAPLWVKLPEERTNED
jgi:hypothetical protein